MADGYISKIKLPDNKIYDFRDQHLKVYTGSCSTAAGTAIKDVTTDGAFTLAKGAVIFVNFNVTNSAAVGNLKLKINGEADANAKPIKYLVNGNDPANIPGAGYLRANQTYMFRYDGTNWVADLNYYTYSNDFANRIGHYNNILARKTIAAESLIVGDETGYEKVASGVTFNLAYPIVWCTGAVNANASNYANMFLQHYDRNIATGAKTGFTSAANKVIYLIVTINGNIATIDSNIITDTLPSSADGKVYISLGKLGAQSTGANYFFLYPTHPMFEYKNGKIRTYEAQQSLNEIDDADDLKAIEAISGTTGLLKKTAANTWTLDTNTYLTAHRTYTAFTGKPTGNQTPGFGDTFTIQQISQNTAGQVSGTDRTVTIPATEASTSAIGLVGTSAQTFGGTKTFNGGMHIYGSINMNGTGTTSMQSGGAYHAGHNSIVLHGDGNGVSGIGFTSQKAADSNTITNINSPSDRAFIQYHAYGVTAAAEGTAPTLATSGEHGTLVIGVGNDGSSTSEDFLLLQVPGATGLKHQIGATAYPIPHTTNTNGSVGGTTTPVYVEAGVIKALSYTIAKSVPSDAVFTDHYAWGDITSKPDTATRWPKWNEIVAGADALSEGTSNWTDNTEILTSYASNNGFADSAAKGVVYRRDALCAYNYIKGKLDSVYIAKTAGVTAVTWDETNKKLTRTINGTAADVMTAAQMSTALGLGSIATYTAATAGTKDTWGKVPVIGGTDGVMEVGKYIDFHTTDGNTADYDVRITAATTGLTISGTTSGTFSGSLSGNATSATSAGKWTTARTLTIGNKGQSVDGSGNVSWSLADIGAATSGHNHSGTYVPNAGGANDINTIVNTGIYNITSGSATNGPKGYGYGQLLVMSYRKHTGNTTTDWASQIYLHNGSGTASGNATAPGNVLYYRTSNNSTSNTWFDWQKAIHADAAYTKVGDTNKPVYITEDGTATAISYTIAKSVPADAKFTDTNTTYTFAEGSTNGAFSVTPSGGSAQSVSIHGLGTAAYKAVENFAAASHTHSYLANTNTGAADRPIYITGNAAAQTTYRMAGTNVTATTALAITNDLDTGIWYVNGTSGILSQSDGAAYVNKYSNSWLHEIYGDYRTGHIAVRGKNNGTWKDWLKVLDSGNYTDYTVTKTGTGASGTWGISITGSAGSVAWANTGHPSTFPPTIGTTSTTAAAGDHTHTISLTQTGTSTVNLAANTVYTLTAGGSSVVFKTPADGNTDTKVNVTATAAAITKNYLLMTSTAPTTSAAGHTALGSTSLWVNAADKGKFELVLGNATATTIAGGQFGQLALYSASTAGTYLKAADGTAWKTQTLQAKDGTIALTSDIPTNLNQLTNGPGYTTNTGTVTSVKLIQGAGITVSSSGTAITTTGERTISITGMDTTNGSTTKWLNQKGGWSTPTAANVGALASSTVVTNVAISADITTNKDYAVVFGTTPSDGTQPTGAKTEGLQKNISKFYFNPYEGNLNATSFSVDESVTLKYNTTDKSLEFIF